MLTPEGPKGERMKKLQKKVLPEVGWRFLVRLCTLPACFLTAEVVAPQVKLREVAQLAELCRYWAWVRARA